MENRVLINFKMKLIYEDRSNSLELEGFYVEVPYFGDRHREDSERLYDLAIQHGALNGFMGWGRKEFGGVESYLVTSLLFRVPEHDLVDALASMSDSAASSEGISKLDARKRIEEYCEEVNVVRHHVALFLMTTSHSEDFEGFRFRYIKRDWESYLPKP